MLLLAIDTSGSSGGITLATTPAHAKNARSAIPDRARTARSGSPGTGDPEAEENSFRVIESAPIAGGTFSAQLIPTVAALLGKHGFSANDLGGFAAASGPGSFTGLRVGLSAIKGLAEVLHKPIAVVSVLEALAASSERNGKIAAALDAGRKEAFIGLYNVAAGQTSLDREELLPQAELADTLRSAGRDQLITSDPAIAHLASAANIHVQLGNRPTSEDIARIGARKLFDGDTVAIEALDANYLRRSDAEIFFKGPR
jgi:tRNA threonylcarbamoyladenosine biosynthesis protein TsaB